MDTAIGSRAGTSANHTADFMSTSTEILLEFHTQKLIAVLDIELDGGKLYPLTCNNRNFNTYNMIECRDMIAIKGGNCQVGPRTAHLCEHGGTKVPGRAFDNTVAVSSCGDVAGGLNDIINVCGGRGG